MKPGKSYFVSISSYRVGTQSKKLKEDILLAFDREKGGLENGV